MAITIHWIGLASGRGESKILKRGYTTHVDNLSSYVYMLIVCKGMPNLGGLGHAPRKF